jgi:hypothetical protein
MIQLRFGLVSFWERGSKRRSFACREKAAAVVCAQARFFFFICVFLLFRLPF